MSPTNEASIQNRITEYLAYALGTDGFFAEHNLGARPTYHRTFSPPISKQGTDMEKVAGDHQYDLAQTFFDRPPFVLEIKTTDLAGDGKTRTLHSPKEVQAHALRQIADYTKSEVFLAYNLTDDFDITPPSTIAATGKSIGICSAAEYLRCCRDGDFTPVTESTLEEKLLKWLRQTPPKNYRPEFGLLSFNGKLLRLYAQICEINGIPDSNIMGLATKGNGLSLFTEPSGKFLDWLISNQDAIRQARDDKHVENLTEYLENHLNQTQLHIAARTGNFHSVPPAKVTVTSLLAMDAFGESAIRIAAQCGHLDKIQITSDFRSHFQAIREEVEAGVQTAKTVASAIELTAIKSASLQWLAELAKIHLGVLMTSKEPARKI